MEAVGLIAGASQFPLLVAREARARGHKVIAAGIREEVMKELADEVDEFHLIGLGELGKLIQIFKKAGVRRAVMAGKVQHKSIFASIKPDFKLLSVLMKLREKNTNAIIGAIADVLADDDITLMDSTAFLRNLLAEEGFLTKTKPSKEDMHSVEYGVKIAREITRLDLGQTVVVKDGACVAIEAMEGTDETIRRAHKLCGIGAVVVKLSKPSQDFRFDVPVCGIGTIEVMAAAEARVLAVEAGRTLLFDREKLLQKADRSGIAVMGIKV
ncbi:MAG: UDP-2,3-diacylglucosamine diphosphatase LpxI [Acidobacteria bacterium]|nr:UDP-2,3-diacylglucosamine diphosphatase LpxI [Acidobacteriota bacterium]